MDFGAGTGVDLKAYIVHHEWAPIMQNNVTSDISFFISGPSNNV